jgi:polyisoprenoid-binding protein YceI
MVEIAGADIMTTRPSSRFRALRAGAPAVALLAALAAAGDDATATRYRVATDASELRVLVYRAGPLAGFGHNHVIVTRALSGHVLLADARHASAVRLEFPVASLVVDEPAARRAEGPAFEGVIPPDDVAATRNNMLGPELLDADNYPTIRIESTALEGTLPNVTIAARVALKGRQYPLAVPVSINTFEGGLVAVGRLRLAHSALGLEPFTVALGSLRVADELQVRFSIVARTDGAP